MRKLMIFLIMALPLIVILILNVTFDAISGVVIIPVDNISIVCGDDNIDSVYDEEHNLSQIKINDITKTVKLTSYVYPESASNKQIYWESDNTNVANVDSLGNVTFVGFGTAEVYAISSDGTRKKSCLFIVTDKRVHDISIYADNTILEIGSTTNIWARVFPGTAENQEYTLSSSNPNIVSVNSAGIATALASGEATIIATAKDGSIGYNCSASLTIKVVKSVTNVRLSPEEESLTLATNEFRLRTIITPIDASNKNVTFTTTDPLIATVSNDGLVKFLKAGEVVITVITQDGNFSDSINLKYTGGYPNSLIINNSKIETNVTNGPEYRQIEYSFFPENPPLQIITFSSNNESVATVDDNGQIKIFGGGEAVITVKVQTSDDLYYFAYIEIDSERKIDAITFPSPTIKVASTNYQISPICLPVDATDVSNLTYSIIEGDCASMTSSGFVTFSSIGQITIKVIDESPLQTESVISFLTIIYTGGYPSDLILDHDEMEIEFGQFNYLTFSLSPVEVSIIDYYYDIESQTPNYGTGDVITLDTTTGKITGISGGTAVIRVFVKIAEDQWISKSCLIKIIKNISSVELSCDEEVYEEQYISAERIFNITTSIFPLDATNPQITYELSNSEIATFINNQIIFNEAGSIILTAYSTHNPNIKSTIKLWYTGNCAVSATIEGIPETIVNGDDPFTVTLSNIIPANALNRSFRIVNQLENNTIAVSYNEDRTEATIRILNAGNSILSFLLNTADSSYEVFSTVNISILQKVDYIYFQYPTQLITVTSFNLQCNIFPENATQNEIVYSIAEGYENIATIDGSLLIFNNSTKANETVIVIATLTDFDGSIKTAQLQLTTTFGIISSPEGNVLNLTVGNSLEYDYTDELTSSSILKVLVKKGDNFISYTINAGIVSIEALGIGLCELEIQLLNKSDNQLIKKLAQLEITISSRIDNITISSNDLTKIGSKYVTAKNDILLNINLFPEIASFDGLKINLSNSIATFDRNTKILHFNSAGTTELTISSPDGSCSRSFIIQYTNGAAVSYAINIETETEIYINQSYVLNITSYLPANANLKIINVTEIISSGSTNGVEIDNSEGFKLTFIKSGTINLTIFLSDGSQKIITLNIKSSLTEILFENENILTALSSFTLYPILLPTTATNKALIYSSSDETIATVTNNGVVTFLKAGEVTIIAQSANNPDVFATCIVRSTKGYVSSFTINYSDLILAVGESRNLIVNSYLPTNASNLNFVYEIVSSTANDGSSSPVIEINGTTISCLNGGTAIIKIYTITENEIVFNTCNVTVIRNLTSISISFDRELDTYQNYLITSLNELNLVINYTPVDATIEYQSLTVDNDDIAKIEDGKLIFLTEGIVKITANYNQKITTITVRYTRSAVNFEIDAPSSVLINDIKNINIRTGNYYEVKVKNVIPSDLSEIDIKLTLYLNSPNYNNDLVCSTTNKTFICGENGGSAIFQVSVNGSTLTEKLKVNVERLATSIITESSIVTPNSVYPLAAYVLPYDTTDKTLTYRVISPATGVSVNSYGIVTFERESTAVIEIKNISSGVIKTVTIDYEIGAKQITFENSINYVFIGNTLSLITRITPYELQNEAIEWSVSDPNLATISANGVLTPKKVEGEVIVTAKLKNYPETISTIKIKIYANVYTIIFNLKNSDDSSCGIAGTRVFVIYSTIGTIKSVNGDITSSITNQMEVGLKSLMYNSTNVPALIWTSSDPSVATVNDKGILTILKAGIVTIKCTPAKQFYTNDPSDSRYVGASYTFTFVEGININTTANFGKWCEITQNIKAYEKVKGGTAPENIQLSYYYAGLPAVLTANLVFNDEARNITKNIFGNGYMLDLQLKIKNTNAAFEVKSNVTINNVYFRGYTFSQGESLTVLRNLSNIINVLNYSKETKFIVTFKNCMFDSGKRIANIGGANVTFSGCILKNSYDGCIVLEPIEKGICRTEVTVNNCVGENHLYGMITNYCELEKADQMPKVTFNGKVYIFNWQDITLYSDFVLDPEFSSLTSIISNEIMGELLRYESRYKKVNGVRYMLIGILSPSWRLTEGTHKTYDCEFINNSNIGYSLDIYENSFYVGSYSLKVWGLNASSTAIEPGDTYTSDPLKYYREIRDLS